MCNLITLPFEHEINHNCKLFISLMNEKYRINGLRSLVEPKSEIQKKLSNWGQKLLYYATTSMLHASIFLFFFQ